MRAPFTCVASVLLIAVVSARPPLAGLAPQGARTPLVFTHVTVIDTVHAIAQSDQTVVVSGDRIAEVGASKTVKVPDDAQVVDATRKFLIPGMWDMHVHTFNHNPRSTNIWFFPLFIANGVTGVRDMWTTGEDFSQVVEWRKGLADGGFPGPRYGAVGWLVDGPEPVWPGSDVVTTPQEARDFVHRAKTAGVDFVKVYTRLLPDQYSAIADEASKLGIPIAGHVPDSVKAADASVARQRSMEHLRNIDLGCSTREDELMRSKTWGPEQAREMRETFDRTKCQKLVEQFAQNQTWQTPTLTVFFQDPSVINSRSKYLPVDVRQRPPPPPLELQNENTLSPAQRERLLIVGMMNRARVPMLAGTDVAQRRLYPGFSLHDELALFVQAGLTPGEALKTATYNPAEFLGMQDRLGTVAKNKLADLVLLDANPFEDIHNTQKIQAVVLNGRYLDRSAPDKLLTIAAAAGVVH